MEEEVILNKIIEDANREASIIIEKAKEKAREIEQQQQRQISQRTEEYFRVIENEVNRAKETEIEKAELESRIAILTKKQEQIKLVLENVKQKIRDLTVSELCEIYIRFISTLPNQSNLEILVQRKNKEEISKGLTKAGYSVSSEQVDFNYGIIVRDGNIEYNYCFEEIMNFDNERLEKLISNILFS